MDQNHQDGQVHEEKQSEEVVKVSHHKANRFSTLKNKKLIVLVLILLAIPLTVGLALVQKNTKSEAAKTTTISFNPTSMEALVGKTVSLDVYVYPGDNLVNFVQLGINFDPKYLQAENGGFTADPGSPISIIDGPVTSSDTITVVLATGTDPTKVINTPTKIGTVTLKPIHSNSSPTQVRFNLGNTVARSISESDNFNENVISSLVLANVSIKHDSNNPPTPTRAPNTSPTPTPGSLTKIPTVTPTPGGKTVILYPNADAFVRSTAPNSNFGNSAVLENDLSPDEISYLKFNLSSLKGKTIKSAKLVLWTSDSTKATLNLKRADDKSWTEGGINFNNRPGFVSNLSSFNANTTNSSVSLNVLSSVNSLKGASVTFGIKSIGDDAGAFHSRNTLESKKRPQLVVEYN